MIHALDTLVEDDTLHGQEVTVRCTVLTGPKVGSRGGEKTLYDVDTSTTTYDGQAFLSIWHEEPTWADDFGETAEYVHELLDDLPLQENEAVLARGVPNVHDGKWYFNVSSLLIRDPDTPIGKSEMRSADECPRIYNLSFEKNVYSPGRYDLSPGSIKGRIVHSLLEFAVKDETYRENFEIGWSDSEIETCLSEIIDQEYTIELALCRLAWISTNRIKEHVWDALMPLLTDEEFTSRIANADELSAEVSLSSALGFNGRVDLLVDGVPYDLKTAYRPTDAQRQKNRFQLRIYLLAFALESLEPGESLEGRLSDGIEGVLVYPNLEDSTGVELEHVELRQQDIESILQLRNEAAVLREGFGIPTTYGRDCQGCRFKEPTGIANGSGEANELPPPCQFYCQSERRWECFETNDRGEVITQCPLFDQCEQRLEFRNPKVTDHYNQLRSALNSERSARRNIGAELEHLEEDVLTQAGLLLPELSLESVEGQRRLYFDTSRTVVPSFSPGDRVRLQYANSEHFRTATYFGRDDGRFVFQLDATPTPAFLDPTATFEARRTIAIDTFPRQLLSQLDYAQRAEITPLLESTGSAGEAVRELSVGELDEVTEHVSNKELYINVPIRPDRTSTVATLVNELSTARLPKPQSDDIVPPEEQRVLVLCSSPTITDEIVSCISSESDVVRMDGFAGSDSTTITPSMDGHEMYTTLEDSSVIVSSTRYALTENVFHAMRNGDSEARPHSDRFFDGIVMVGAETLTEPQFHFLRVLGDRIFSIGDAHRPGPEMVSGAARDSRLGESYFDRLYRRFANLDNPDSQSLVLPGELSSPMVDAFSNLDVPLSEIAGTVEFVGTEGTTSAALPHINLEYRFPCQPDEQEPRFVRLEPIEDVDAPQVARAFEDLRTLDASEFTIQETYTIQDIQFEIKTNNPVSGEEHQVKVQVPIRATPFLNRHLTHNQGEASAVVDLCEERNPDAVVTPFVAHANEIMEQLNDTNLDEIPVLLPDDLSGEQLDTTIVSFGISDEKRIVTPPINNIETLYTLLNSGRNVVIVGSMRTLERNSVLKALA